MLVNALIDSYPFLLYFYLRTEVFDVFHHMLEKWFVFDQKVIGMMASKSENVGHTRHIVLPSFMGQIIYSTLKKFFWLMEWT